MDEQATEIFVDMLEELIDSRIAALSVTATVSDEGWLTTRGAAGYLDCPVSRIYDLVALRRIRRYKDGTRLRFRRSDLDAYMEKSV